MMTDLIDVDVRPILRSGGEPFAVIMAAVDRLEPGQGLRLYVTFRPVPLFGVMASRGFSHLEIEHDDGDWEVIFQPENSLASQVEATATNFDEWPEPVVTLDNRDLDPPEPMVRILTAAGDLRPGDTLTALLSREPVFLFPELEKRGYHWLGGFTPDGSTYEITIRSPL